MVYIIGIVAALATVGIMYKWVDLSKYGDKGKYIIAAFAIAIALISSFTYNLVTADEPQEKDDKITIKDDSLSKDKDKTNNKVDKVKDKSKDKTKDESKSEEKDKDSSNKSDKDNIVVVNDKDKDNGEKLNEKPNEKPSLIDKLFGKDKNKDKDKVASNNTSKAPSKSKPGSSTSKPNTSTSKPGSSNSTSKPKPSAPQKPTEKPSKPAEKPADKPSKPVEKPSKPVEKPSKPVEKPADKPSKPVEKPADKPSKPVEKPADKPSKPVEKPADKPNKPADKVEYKKRQEREEFYYDIKVEGTDELYIGEEKIKTTGQNGYIVTEYTDKYVNGVKVDTTSKVIDKKDKVDEVILAGTKVRMHIDDAQSREVIHAVNAYRKSKGVATLEWDEALYNAAKVRAEEILENFDHFRPDGTDFSTAMDEAGVVYWGAGENIAAGQHDVADVMISWKNSPGHNGTMLNEAYTHMAAAKLDTSYGGYWVQLFIRK